MKRCSEAIDHQGLRIRIRVAGRLDADWSSWFEGLTVTALEKDETRLDGIVADQAALHGLLSRIRDLGIPLLGLEVTDEAAGSRDRVVAPPHPPRSGRHPT